MKWENIAIAELEFYKSSFKNLERLKAAIKEIDEDDCCYPTVTIYHEEEGRIFTKSPNIEDIVINRIERKETLEKGVERLNRKVSFIEKALNLINEDEREAIDCLVLYPGELELRKVQVLVGVRSQNELMRLKRKALLRFYRYLRTLKAEHKQAVRKQSVKDQHQEAINFMKRQQEKEVLQKKQRQLFIQDVKRRQRMLI